jgi:hypothetical protein
MLMNCCNSPNNINISSDFAFCLQGKTNKINTFDSTLSRKYWQRDTVIKIVFSKNDLKVIYNVYLKYDLDRLPDYYNPKGRIMRLPASVDTFTIRFNGKIKRIVYSSSLECSKLRDKYYYFKLNKFFTAIYSIIDNNKDYNSIEKSNMIFL